MLCTQNTTAAVPHPLVTLQSVQYGLLLAWGIMYSGMWTGANGNLTVVGFVYAQIHLYTLTLSHISHAHSGEHKHASKKLKEKLKGVVHRYFKY